MSSEDTKQPVFDVTGKEIAQVGIVVHDAVKTAKQYAEIFGIGPWTFFDDVARNVVLWERHMHPIRRQIEKTDSTDCV